MELGIGLTLILIASVEILAFIRKVNKTTKSIEELKERIQIFEDKIDNDSK